MSTRVPAIRDELFARLSAAMTEWQCFDGPPAAVEYEENVLVVGHQSTGGGFTVENEVTRQQGMGHRYSEVFEIGCVLSSTSGDEQVFSALRATLLGGLEQIEAILKADRALGGLCDLLGLGSGMNWVEESNRNGSTAEVLFSIVGRSVL